MLRNYVKRVVTFYDRLCSRDTCDRLEQRVIFRRYKIDTLSFHYVDSTYIYVL